jgi:hypothetical protein
MNNNDIQNAARLITDLRDAEAHMYEKDRIRLGIILCLCSASFVCGAIATVIWAYAG